MTTTHGIFKLEGDVAHKRWNELCDCRVGFLGIPTLHKSFCSTEWVESV